MHRRQVLSVAAGALVANPIGALIAAPNPTAVDINIFNFWQKFCYGSVLVRQNIYTLASKSSSHPVIAAYATAVSVMKQRSIADVNDPIGWTYQANIHGTTLPQSQWPAGAPFETCEHSEIGSPTIFFLTWHRIYLYYFERIVRQASGYPDFALPYWNYSQAGQAALPVPFRDESVNGSPNPLYDPSRAGGVNTGVPLPASAVTSSSALGKLGFLGSNQFQRTLESTPHGTVHTNIAGNMGKFSTAGRDPIFWLHHCNIDRLWEKWLSQNAGRANPVFNSTWMTAEFKFVDENKQFVTMSGADVLQIANQLGYQYADPHVCTPLLALVSPTASEVSAAERSATRSIVLARDISLPANVEPFSIRATDVADQEGLLSSLQPETVQRVLGGGGSFALSIEGIRTRAAFNGHFEVYVGLPAGEVPSPTSPYYVGNLSLFGADEESRSQMGQHGDHGGGLAQEIDVTEAVRRLVQVSEGRATDLVTLVPVGVPSERGGRFVPDPNAVPTIEAILLNIISR